MLSEAAMRLTNSIIRLLLFLRDTPLTESPSLRSRGKNEEPIFFHQWLLVRDD